MKIAQIEQSRTLMYQRLNKQIQFSSKLSGVSTELDLSNNYEVYKLFKEIEDMLKIFKLLDLKLDENNSLEYNSNALFEYSDLQSIYHNIIEQMTQGDQKYTRSVDYQQIAKLMNVERRCFNNIGCLWFAVGAYHEAALSFNKASLNYTDYENHLLQQLSRAQHMDYSQERLARVINY